MKNLSVKGELNIEKNSKLIEFICTKCKITENIPTDIVEMLDAMDSAGKDLSCPPRFNPRKM